MPMKSMMDYIIIADKLAHFLETGIKNLPEGFYSSFRYTQTGNNLTHPFTLGILSRKLWEFPEISNVGIDVRLNCGSRIKFQPDLVGFNSTNQMIIFVDYESPNSSDARIPKKDIDTYLAWQQKTKNNIPYVIITTLPDQYAPDWELRYTAQGYYNETFRGQHEKLKKNPYRFWYQYYTLEFSKRKMSNIALININCKNVQRKYPNAA